MKEQVPSFGMQHQMQIYLEGIQQKTPEIPVAYEDLMAKAKQIMKPEAFAYIAGGAGGGSTIKNNDNSFNKWNILPKMLADVSHRDLSVSLFGKKYPFPVLLAPIGVLSIAHTEAEVAVAKAAKSLGIPQILSTVSSKSLEEVAETNAENPHWFQLYWGGDHEFTQSLISRAEKAGYEAIVITLDTRVLAWREKDIQSAYLPFLYGEGLANYFSDPVFKKTIPEPNKNKMEAIMHFTKIFSNTSLTWEELKYIREYTNLPVILKGIQHPEDAEKAVDYGADGIIVSNHGGRQIDGAVAALEMLPEIVERVGDEISILFDSGIRRGADVFKAIALGAEAVLLGRPYAFGLGIAGERGVKAVIQNLLADTDLTMALVGCTSWAEAEEMIRKSK